MPPHCQSVLFVRASRERRRQQAPQVPFAAAKVCLQGVERRAREAQLGPVKQDFVCRVCPQLHEAEPHIRAFTAELTVCEAVIVASFVAHLSCFWHDEGTMNETVQYLINK